MNGEIDRREFLKLAGVSGVVFISGLTGMPAVSASAYKNKDFFFVQMSDSHWGFEGDKINPDAKGTLDKGCKRSE